MQIIVAKMAPWNIGLCIHISLASYKIEGRKIGNLNMLSTSKLRILQYLLHYSLLNCNNLVNAC